MYSEKAVCEVLGDLKTSCFQSQQGGFQEHGGMNKNTLETRVSGQLDRALLRPDS